MNPKIDPIDELHQMRYQNYDEQTKRGVLTNAERLADVCRQGREAAERMGLTNLRRVTLVNGQMVEVR